ncbi:MAG: hypothetical protein LBL71_01445 [Endomicrobium sp.]|jgi:hypothetical protein|nr:hypothetical protein [Endomicrobium sp.]
MFYFLILALLLVISWAMMLNISCLIIHRMKLQNEADCTALSIAAYKARVLNFLGNTNYLMAEILSLGMNARITQLVSYSTDVVCGFPATMNYPIENPMSDLKHKIKHYKKDNGVKIIKSIVDAIQRAQDTAVKSYYSYYYTLLSKNASANKNYNIIVLPVKPDKNLGLKRNSKGINYYSTINSVCVYLGPSKHFHILHKNKYKRSRYSWFVRGEKFSNQKVKVILREKTSTVKPLFSKLIGIHYPQITVFSAASPYNVNGPMFPGTEDSFTGATKMTMVLAETASLLQLALLEKAIAHACFFGPYVLPFVAGAEAALAGNYLLSKEASLRLASKRDNPIDAYLNAKSGGWGAHLVPYGKKDNT